MNYCINSGRFPKIGKKSQLILIPKPPKSPEHSSTAKYRPICLLNGYGKLLETLIKNRLLEETTEKNNLHPNQFGYKKGTSAINAVNLVKETVDKIREKAYKNR